MEPYTPLWKRGARGDFIKIILKSPFIPLCQRGIKIPVTEGLQIFLNSLRFNNFSINSKSTIGYRLLPGHFVWDRDSHSEWR